MYIVHENVTDELIIKNSKFITIIEKINSSSDVEIILTEIKKIYPDATHYTYAYILGNIKRSSDDGEPSGTAGMPILKVLEHNDLSNVLAIVVRYFGGIKLGANGLIRAYTKSVTNAFKKTKLNELIDGVNIELIFNYNQIKEVDYLLKDIHINDKTYGDIITYNINIPKSFLEKIENNNYEFRIIKEIKIEKDY